MTELLSPNQIGPASTKMSAASTLSKITGQSSVAQPCSRISGQTPVAMSWSMALTTSTATPLVSMIRALMSIRPCVLLTSGDRLSVQLMNNARSPPKEVDGSDMAVNPTRAQGVRQCPHRNTQQSNVLDQELTGHGQHGKPARRGFANTGGGEQEADRGGEEPDCHHAAHGGHPGRPRLHGE